MVPLEEYDIRIIRLMKEPIDSSLKCFKYCSAYIKDSSNRQDGCIHKDRLVCKE